MCLYACAYIRILVIRMNAFMDILGTDNECAYVCSKWGGQTLKRIGSSYIQYFVLFRFLQAGKLYGVVHVKLNGASKSFFLLLPFPLLFRLLLNNIAGLVVSN